MLLSVKSNSRLVEMIFFVGAGGEGGGLESWVFIKKIVAQIGGLTVKIVQLKSFKMPKNT